MPDGLAMRAEHRHLRWMRRLGSVPGPGGKNSFLTCRPFTAVWCRRDEATNCVVSVDERCGLACTVGARQGCTGGEGQMCASPSGACVDGLTCVDGVCTASSP